MAHIAGEMMWLKNLLLELGFKQPRLILMFCDNQSDIHIAQNHMFYEDKAYRG